jgi:ATP adenylyltransferase
VERSYFFNFEKMSYVQSKRAPGCLLCRLRDRDAEVVDLTVHQDDLVAAAVNLYPYNPGHLMVFPVRHVEDVRELTADEEQRISQIVRRLLTVLDRTHRPQGYNIGYNMGLAAGASIRHLHVHVIPRYPSEIGIADLIGGKRVLVEDPRVTRERVQEALAATTP